MREVESGERAVVGAVRRHDPDTGRLGPSWSARTRPTKPTAGDTTGLGHACGSIWSWRAVAEVGIRLSSPGSRSLLGIGFRLGAFAFAAAAAVSSDTTDRLYKHRKS